MPRKYKTRNSKKKIYGGSSNETAGSTGWNDSINTAEINKTLQEIKEKSKGPGMGQANSNGTQISVGAAGGQSTPSGIGPTIQTGPAGQPQISVGAAGSIGNPSISPLSPLSPNQTSIGQVVPSLQPQTVNPSPSSISPTGINIGPASGPLPIPALDPSGDPKITTGFDKLQSYQGRCVELQDNYLYKHQEVLWYCGIINQLKDKIINIIQNHTHNNQINIDYILNLIDTLEIDNDINMDNLREKKEEQDTKIQEVTNTLQRIQQAINDMTSKADPIVTNMVFPTRQQFGEKFTTQAPTIFDSQQMRQMPHRSAPIVQSRVPVMAIEPRDLGTTTTTETITEIGNKITNLQAFCQNLKLAYDDKHDNEIRPLYNMIIEIEGIITELGQIIGEDTTFYQSNFNLLIEAINGLPDYTTEMAQLQELRRQQANLLGQAQYNMEQIIIQKNDFIKQLKTKRNEYERNNASVSGSNSFPAVPTAGLSMAAAPNSSSAPSGPSKSNKGPRRSKSGPNGSSKSKKGIRRSQSGPSLRSAGNQSRNNKLNKLRLQQEKQKEKQKRLQSKITQAKNTQEALRTKLSQQTNNNVLFSNNDFGGGGKKRIKTQTSRTTFNPKPKKKSVKRNNTYRKQRRGIIKRCCDRDTRDRKDKKYYGKIKPHRGKRVTLKTNNKNVNRLKKLVNKEVYYTMEDGYAVNPREIAFNAENVDFPPLTANVMPKRRGPAYQPGTMKNLKNTKGRPGRPVGATWGLTAR